MRQSRPTVPDDRDAISGLRAGRLDAFKQLFDAYAAPLWRFAAQSVPRDAADDIVQDVMFDLWRRRDVVQVNDGLAPYLFGAVRNRVSKYLRHVRVVERTAERAAADPAHVDPLGMGSQPSRPDAEVLSGELESAVVATLATLTETQRAVLMLRWEREMPYDQVAETLSISPDAARQHASRAMRAIRPLLARWLGE
jgi:RNA polymerase sigma-70 factor (ECF subfamily)